MGNDRLGQSLPNCDVRVADLCCNVAKEPSAEVGLGSTWLIAGRFSSTPNFEISAIAMSSFAQQATKEDLKGLGEKWEIEMNVVQPVRGQKGATPIDLDGDPHGTESRALVDTHRHPIGPKLAAKMAERGFYELEPS